MEPKKPRDTHLCRHQELGKPRPSKTLHQFDIATKTDHYFFNLQKGEGGV